MVSSKIKEALETRPFWPGERDDAELGAHHGTLRAPLDQPPDALSDLEIAPLFLRSGACQATEPEGVGADRFMGPDPNIFDWRIHQRRIEGLSVVQFSFR